MNKYSLLILSVAFVGTMHCQKSTSTPNQAPTLQPVWYECAWEDEQGKTLLQSGQYLPSSLPDLENCIVEDESGKVIKKFPCGPKTKTSQTTQSFPEGKYKGYFVRQTWDAKQPNALQSDIGYQLDPKSPERILSTKMFNPISTPLVHEFKEDKMVFRMRCEAKPDKDPNTKAASKK